jgi:hypothetical protein
MIGTAKYVMGRAAETEAHINEALRLSPRDVFAYRWMIVVGFAKLHCASIHRRARRGRWSAWYSSICAVIRT